MLITFYVGRGFVFPQNLSWRGVVAHPPHDAGATRVVINGAVTVTVRGCIVVVVVVVVVVAVIEVVRGVGVVVTIAYMKSEFIVKG